MMNLANKVEVLYEASMIARPSAKQLRNFLAKIDMSGGPDACWPWLGACDACGYGRFRVGERLESAHRVAMAWLGGKPPRDGDCTLHTCDNPPCCNPRHLYYGTQRDNALDRETRGRGNHPSGPAISAIARARSQRGDDHWARRTPEYLARGVRHDSAKLDDKKVVAICESTEAHAALARRYGVTEVSIAAVRAGKTWTHVVIDGPRDRRERGVGDKRIGPKLDRRKLTDEQVREIRASTETNVALAKRYGVTDTTISLTRRRLLYLETK